MLPVEKAVGISSKKGISSWTFSHEGDVHKLFIPNDLWMILRKMIEAFLLKNTLNKRHNLSSLSKRQYVIAEGGQGCKECMERLTISHNMKYLCMTSFLY